MGKGAPGLRLPEASSSIAAEVEVDTVDHFLWRDQMHTVGQAIDDIHASMFWPVLFIAITQGNTARAPATAVGATRKRANGVDELVVRVGFPMRRFASACNDNARTIPPGHPWFALHCCRQ